MVTIIMDQRERSTGMAKEFVKEGFEVEIQQLVIADYIVKTKDIYGEVVSVGIERKTTRDFLTSMVDKRLLAQLVDLKKNFSRALLILEGTDNLYQIRDFHPNAIRGMLATISVDFQVPIIPTRNPRDTASFIKILAKRLEKERTPLNLLLTRKPQTLHEQQECILQALPSIGPTISKELLKKFKSVRNVANASADALEEVPKIGKKKAQKIREVFDAEYPRGDQP